MPENALWRDFWLLLGLGVLAQLVYVGSVNRQVLVQRMGLKRGTERWDWGWLTVFTLALFAILLVAHRDIRAGGLLLPDQLRVVGLALFLSGWGLFLRAMGENPFFEKTVRIQHEREHRVIESGPYRFVRHPGYVGLILWVLSLPLLLTSPLAIYPAVFTAVWFVVRTALEDRTLREKLPGYGEYAARVRCRLMPGVW